MQVREGFLEEVGELGFKGQVRHLRQRNGISKAWGQGEHGLLLRKSGCQPARKGRFRTLISFYVPISSSILPSPPQNTGFFGVVADQRSGFYSHLFP